MSVKKEGTGRGSEHQLGRYLKDRYVGGPDTARWYLGGHIPRLGEARGRIVLVRRFKANDELKSACGGHFGIDAQSWPDNCEDGTVGGGLIRVQDFYEVGESTNITKKISFTRAHLERAAELRHHHDHDQKHHHPFFVNFLSASNFFNASCWPERVARKVNPAVVEYLCARHGEEGKGEQGLGVGDAGTGIVVTDWVGANGDWDLIRCIVGMNSRLQLKQ
jgi:1-phosphatidylinositol phosphodiesterase